MTLRLVVALASAYLLGSIPTAYLLVKRLKHLDIRTIGSGNVGATNVARATGLWAGLAVFLIDLAKGFIAVQGIAPSMLRPLTAEGRLLCGLLAVVGHCFPIFLQFRGGKGVATTIGVLAGAVPLIAFFCLVVWGACFAIWRYVSIASIAAAGMIPLGQAITHQRAEAMGIGVALAVLVIARHRSNFVRLLHGQEHRVGRRR